MFVYTAVVGINVMPMLLYIISCYWIFTLVCFEFSDQITFLVKLKTNQEKGNDDQDDNVEYFKFDKVIIKRALFIKALFEKCKCDPPPPS